MMINLYPDIIHEGDLSPEAVGDEIDEAVEVSLWSQWSARRKKSNKRF
jgi:hypothetical protein